MTDPKIEFKRDAAPSVFAPMPWALSRGRDRVLDALGRPIGTCNPKTAQFILAAVNERAAMLAEIDRLRQAVVDERGACAAIADSKADAFVDAFIAAERNDSPDAETWLRMAGGYRALAAAIRARSTP